jgi:hypothetical protein
MNTIIAIAFLVAAMLSLPPTAAAAEADAGRTPSPPPERIGQAGLFVTGSTTELRPELLPFSPQYPLWSDGTTKRRWIALPPGSAIDATDPNAWEFPRGTRLYKEFSFGRRVETRVIERLADGSWRYGTYVWTEDGRDAVRAPEDGIASLPVAEAPSGRYAVPSEYDCRACHEGAAVPVLGFSALQLSPDRDPLAPHADRENPTDLRALVARGLLRNLPPALSESPPRITAATPIERAALGYLHGNCGHCHVAPAEDGASVPVDLLLAHDAAADGAASAAMVLGSLLGASSRFRPTGAAAPPQVVVPGAAGQSLLTLRMRSRDPRVQMPPLGTFIPDPNALALIERWIDGLAPLESRTRTEEP